MVRHGHCEYIGEHSCESFVDRVNSPTATNMVSVCPLSFLLAPMTLSKEKRAGCGGFKEVRCYKDGLVLQKLWLQGCVAACSAWAPSSLFIPKPPHLTNAGNPTLASPWMLRTLNATAQRRVVMAFPLLRPRWRAIRTAKRSFTGNSMN